MRWETWGTLGGPLTWRHWNRRRGWINPERSRGWPKVRMSLIVKGLLAGWRQEVFEEGSRANVWLKSRACEVLTLSFQWSRGDSEQVGLVSSYASKEWVCRLALWVLTGASSIRLIALQVSWSRVLARKMEAQREEGKVEGKTPDTH